MSDYYVRLVAMPLGVHGVTVPNTDGSFDIYINSRLSLKQQEATLEHEKSHISRDHFNSRRSTASIAREAEGAECDPALCPPEGMLPLFPDEASLSRWIGDRLDG